MNILQTIKLHLWDGYDKCITGYAAIYLFILSVVMLICAINSYEAWQCSKYEEVTGFTTKYVEWDVCYVQGSDGVYIRYDSNYKSVE